MSFCQSTVPDVGFMSPIRVLRRIDFPAPLGPIIARTSFFSMSKEMLYRMFWSPRVTERFFTWRRDMGR